MLPAASQEGSEEKVEYRVWNPFRSKLGAGALHPISIIIITSCSSSSSSRGGGGGSSSSSRSGSSSSSSSSTSSSTSSITIVIISCMLLGRGDDAVGNPHGAQICLTNKTNNNNTKHQKTTKQEHKHDFVALGIVGGIGQMPIKPGSKVPPIFMIYVCIYIYIYVYT